jgi:regulator of protease activity HflC (stomatin/prohibitin superfamily)
MNFNNTSPRTIQVSPRRVLLFIFGTLTFFIGSCGLYKSVYTVETGENALVKTFGDITDVTSEGLHFKIPFVQSAEKVDIRTRKAEAPASASSKDLQAVHAEVSVNYRLDANKLRDIYKNTGLDVEVKLIDPRIQETVKSVTAKYSASELVSLREQVRSEIETALKNNLKPFHVIVEAIQITNFDFSKAFTDAVEAKQTAEQTAMKAKMDLERIKIEAEQQIVTAKATAEQIRIQAEAIQKQGGREYVELERIKKWNGVYPTHMLGNNTSVILGQ